MCVEDIVRDLLRQKTRLAMLGFYYGVTLSYIFFTKLEYIASGPLHIISSVASELFQDLLTENEMELFQEGLTQGLIAVLSCPLFYRRELRKIFLSRTMSRIKHIGTSLYRELIVPRLSEPELNTLRQVASSCVQDKIIPYTRVELTSEPTVLMRRLGLVVHFGYVFIPFTLSEFTL